MQKDTLLDQVYKDHLRTENFNTDNFRALLPFVLEHGKTYKRSDCIRILVAYHEKLSGKKVSKTVEQLGNSLKKAFSDKNAFKSEENIRGGWTYIGPSYNDEPQETFGDVETPSTISETECTSQSFEVRKQLNATITGDQTLYVWWHPESETLAKLEARDDWPMKIGIHHERNVKNRIADYKTPIPYKPIFGLLVHCEKAIILEKSLHSTLKNRKKMIGEMGHEWFVTSISEIEEILVFNHLIEKQYLDELA